MKRRIFSILFALVLVVSFSLVAAVPASADELIVGPAQYRTIQDAINAANLAGGDTIIVAEGTYKEAIVIDRPLTLLGANHGVNPVTEIRGTESIIDASTISGNAVKITASGVIFDGFTVAKTDGSGIYVGKGVGLQPEYQIENIKVQNNVISQVYILGITLGNVKKAAVSNNLINDTYDGIYLHFAIECVISGNKVTGSWAATEGAITFESDCHNNTFNYNILENNAGAGVYFWPQAASCSGNKFNYNNISGNAIGVEAASGAAVPVDAENNWWGSASGPTHASNTYTAPDGDPQGDAVSDLVDFVPWLGGPYPSVISVVPVSLDAPPGQFSSIQAAIDAATHTTITCVAGTYTEAVLILGKTLTLLGEPGAIIKPDASTPTYDSYAGAPFVDKRRAGIYIYQVDGVIIDGFEIDGTGTDVHYGIIGKYSDGSIVRNCVVHDIVNKIESPISDVAGVGIMFYNEAVGAWSGVHGAVIERNVVYKTGRMGIFLGGYTGGWLKSSNNVIRGNEVYDTWQGPTAGSGGALTILGASGSLIQRNTIYNTGLDQCGISILGWASDPNGIIENDIYNNYVGIKVSGGVAEVHYNNIYENAMGLDNQGDDTVDALYNWWGDETGPEHTTLNTGAQGNAVSDEVDFSPWLYKTQEEFISGAPCYAGSVVIGKEATEVVVEETPSLKGGWNTFSTPILLDSSADFVSELLDLTAGSDLSIVRAQRYDPVEGWVALVMGGLLIEDYQINPGEGFFIQVEAKGSLPILCSMELFWPQSRELSPGWNLVGAPSYRDKLVEDGLSSLGAATVVNSPGANPVSWSYPPAFGTKKLLPGRAYWVAMSADGTLMCFDGTPVADGLTWHLNQ